MESGSILETIGQEIISVMSPVSICMLLVVLLIYSVYNPSSIPSTIRTAANLVYLENPSDSTSQKLEGALLNAAVFILIITLVTFLLLLLYYFRFTSFLLHYTRFSVFTILSAMGSSILISLIQRFDVPVDAPTFYFLLFNLTVVGTVSVFSRGVPIVVRQGTLVALGIIVAAWFSRLPEWTTWVVLVALAVYDLVAVLAPGGPLKLLVELASSRDEELPALVYEARPSLGRSGVGLVAPGIGMNSDNGAVELQVLLRNGGEVIDVVEEGRVGRGEIEEVRETETTPLIEERGESGNVVEDRVLRRDEREGVEMEEMNARGIKLGMGDFIFYSVLVGRAAMYDLMTVYACYLAIISGLGCTLVLLAVCRHALPALPISIALGVMFYFLTRMLMEPFVVGAATNLVMF